MSVGLAWKSAAKVTRNYSIKIIQHCIYLGCTLITQREDAQKSDLAPSFGDLSWNESITIQLCNVKCRVFKLAERVIQNWDSFAPLHGCTTVQWKETQSPVDKKGTVFCFFFIALQKLPIQIDLLRAD